MDSLIPKSMNGWAGGTLVGAILVAALGVAFKALIAQAGTEVEVVEVRADVADVRADVKDNRAAIAGIRTLAHEQAKGAVRTEGHVAGINAKLEDISKTMDKLEKQQRRRGR